MKMNLEVHFYDDETASVLLESNSHDKDELFFGKILLFSCFTLRQMVNLGDNASTSTLAFMLMLPSEKNDPLELLKILGGQGLNPVKLVPKGENGKKRFLASLKCSEENMDFKLHTKGFGFFARGVNYYAPHSVVLLLRHLINENADNKKFIASLCLASRQCSNVYHGGELSIANQQEFALAVTHKASTG